MLVSESHPSSPEEGFVTKFLRAPCSENTVCGGHQHLCSAISAAPRGNPYSQTAFGPGISLFNGPPSSERVLALPQDSAPFSKRGSSLATLVLPVPCGLTRRSTPHSPNAGCGPKFPRHVSNRLRFSAHFAAPRGNPTAKPFSAGRPPASLADVFGTDFFRGSFSNRGSLLAILYLEVVCVVATGLPPFHPEVVCAPKTPLHHHSGGLLACRPAFRTTKLAGRQRHTSTAAFYHTGVHHCYPIFWPPPENCRDRDGPLCNGIGLIVSARCGGRVPIAGDPTLAGLAIGG
jgi:hypothetical protein